MQLSRLPHRTDRSLPSISEKIRIKEGERWLLMGTSGSGKTTAGKLIDRQLLRLYPETPHYILDTQAQGDFDSYAGVIQRSKAPDVIKKHQAYQIWQPTLVYPEEVEKWLDQIFHRYPAVLLIDELYVLKYKGAQNYSNMYSILQRAGRARNITTITHTQKLGKIPSDAYEQSTHRLGFYMEGTYNKFIRSQMLKSEHLENPVDTYGFHYQHINGRGTPFYYRNIQQFLGG